MTFDPASRYTMLPEIEIEAPDGSVRVMCAPRVVPEPQTAGQYQVREGDRLDHLGRAATGEARQSSLPRRGLCRPAYPERPERSRRSPW